MAGPLSPPPPDRPEVPAGVVAPGWGAAQAPDGEVAPRWPWGFAFLGFLVAILLVGLLLAIAGAATGAEPGKKPGTTLIVVGTLIQGVIFAGVAVMFASFVSRPRAWHFGLRRASLGPAIGWAALGMLSFYLFAASYGALVQTDVEQTVTEDLGADRGTVGLIVAGCMVMIVAPIGEEFFFRGFFYRALRSRFSIAAAAVVDGVVFGLLHGLGNGVEGLLLVPPLAVLGLIFCLVYEKTGSLWPVIAMHAFNNAVAYAVQTGDDGGWKVSLVVGPLMIAATMLAPRLLPGGPRGSRSLPVADPQPAAVR